MPEEASLRRLVLLLGLRDEAASRVACPVCNSKKIAKGSDGALGGDTLAAATPGPAEMREMLVKLRRHVERTGEHVGERASPTGAGHPSRRGRRPSDLWRCDARRRRGAAREASRTARIPWVPIGDALGRSGGPHPCVAHHTARTGAAMTSSRHRRTRDRPRPDAALRCGQPHHRHVTPGAGSGALLMVAHMNETALRLTVGERRRLVLVALAHVWRKGETSGTRKGGRAARRLRPGRGVASGRADRPPPATRRAFGFYRAVRRPDNRLEQGGLVGYEAVEAPAPPRRWRQGRPYAASRP